MPTGGIPPATAHKINARATTKTAPTPYNKPGSRVGSTRPANFGCFLRFRAEIRGGAGKRSTPWKFCSNKCEQKRKRTITPIGSDIVISFIVIIFDVFSVLEQSQVPQFSAEQCRGNDATEPAVLFGKRWSRIGVQFPSNIVLVADVVVWLFAGLNNILDTATDSCPSIGNIVLFRQNARWNGNEQRVEAEEEPQSQNFYTKPRSLEHPKWANQRGANVMLHKRWNVGVSIIATK